MNFCCHKSQLEFVTFRALVRPTSSSFFVRFSYKFRMTVTLTFLEPSFLFDLLFSYVFAVFSLQIGLPNAIGQRVEMSMIRSPKSKTNDSIPSRLFADSFFIVLHPNWTYSKRVRGLCFLLCSKITVQLVVGKWMRDRKSNRAVPGSACAELPSLPFYFLFRAENEQTMQCLQWSPPMMKKFGPRRSTTQCAWPLYVHTPDSSSSRSSSSASASCLVHRHGHAIIKHHQPACSRLHFDLLVDTVPQSKFIRKADVRSLTICILPTSFASFAIIIITIMLGIIGIIIRTFFLSSFFPFGRWRTHILSGRSVRFRFSLESDTWRRPRSCVSSQSITLHKLIHLIAPALAISLSRHSARLQINCPSSFSSSFSSSLPLLLAANHSLQCKSCVCQLDPIHALL